MAAPTSTNEVTARRLSEVLMGVDGNGGIKKAVDDKITAAVEALDVAEVGGDGKYIKKIKEDDGKITATVETMDTTPTASSTKAVTSGGVKTALDGKASSTHTHGNITNGGALQTNDITIASGDKLVVTDASDSNKIARTSIAFDGSTTGQLLSQAGSFQYPKEAYLTWGGRNIAGGISPVDSALVDRLRANRYAGMYSGVTVEYTRDGGTTWVDYGASESSIRRLFISDSEFVIGKANSSNKATADENWANYKLRIRIDCSLVPLYAPIQKNLIRVSINGSRGTKVTLKGLTKANRDAGNDTWNGIGSMLLNGWSGWNVLNSGYTTFGTWGGSTSFYSKLEYLFEATAASTESDKNFEGLKVFAIYAFSTSPSQLPSTLASNGTPYSVDEYLNVQFGKNLTASKFIGPVQGNADTATKISSAKKLAVSLSNTTTDTTFDGSADVTNIKVSGTLPVSQGGTGKTTVTAAEYNLLSKMGTDLSPNDIADNYRFVFGTTSPSETNGRLAGYRTASSVWAWVKGKLSSDTSVDISGNAATATSATNVDLTGSVKTTSTTNGDTIQVKAGSGTAAEITIVNAKHAASADTAKDYDTSSGTIKTALEGKASSTHTHGNITNGGALQTTDVAIATGDKLVITDSSDSNRVARTSTAFDGSTTTTALTPKGTFESFQTPLDAQTAYSAKGSATKVPQITTNSLGQVTGISEVTISGVTPASHSHGSITNDGKITADGVALASGDSIVIVDSSDSSKVKKTSVTFDGSTATQALTKKGTWETFNNYTHPTTSGNKHVPSGGQSGQFLGWDSDGTAKWVANPNTDTKVKATAKTDDVNYKILATSSASPTSGSATEAVYDADITLNPSTNTISANVSGTAASASKLTTARKTYVTLGTASTTTTRDWSGDTTIPVSGQLKVANGGTGASDASGARTNLEVYSKTEVDGMLGGRVVFVASLPATGDSGVTYYVGPTGTGADQYDEYVWNGSAFVKVGEHSIDLSDYVNTLTKSGSGSVVTNISKSGNTVTWTQGNISLDNLSTWASVTDVTVDSVSYHTYWPTAPTSSNQVYGVSITSGKLYQVYNNKGTYTVRSYDKDSDTTYTNEKLGQGYGTCTTEEATAAKTVTLSGYVLTKGGIVAVKFTNGLCASATMNVNGKGAKAIYVHGASVTGITAREVKALDVAYFMYDGSYYHFLGTDRVFKDAITGLSASGTTVTYTKADGSTGTITTQDTQYTFDGTYNASTNKAATVSTVTNAVNALDVSNITGFGAGKTLATLTETNGKIAATFQDISITTSQVSDFPTSMTPTSHTHGNIQNGGTLQTTDVTIATGDKLVITDSSNSNKVARASISFDGSTTTQALTKAGTWATFNNYSHPTGSAASKTGVPTADAAPAFGGTFKVNQITTDDKSHVASLTERTITIPNTTGTASTAGLTKLYTGTGTNTDGTMTQNAIKTALDGKADDSSVLHTSDKNAVSGVAGLDSYGYLNRNLLPQKNFYAESTKVIKICRVSSTTSTSGNSYGLELLCRWGAGSAKIFINMHGDYTVSIVGNGINAIDKITFYRAKVTVDTKTYIDVYARVSGYHRCIIIPSNLMPSSFADFSVYNTDTTLPTGTEEEGGAVEIEKKFVAQTSASSGTYPVKTDAYGNLSAVVVDSTPTTGNTTNLVSSDGVSVALSSKAPTSHASSSTTYGVGTTENYGHVKLDNSTPLAVGTSNANGVATGKAHIHDALESVARASVTTADLSHINTNTRAHMIFSQISSQTSTTHDPGDGYMMSFMWDYTDMYDAQLFIPNSGTDVREFGRMKIRYRNNNVWGDWEYLPAAFMASLLTSEHDLDTLKGDGFGNILGYRWDSTSTPVHTAFSDNHGGQLLVFGTSQNNWATQIEIRSGKGIYQRRLANNVWGNWEKMLVDSDVPELTSTDAASIWNSV